MDEKKWAGAAVSIVSVVVLSFFLNIMRDFDRSGNSWADWDDIPKLERKGIADFDRDAVYERNVWGIENPQQFFISVDEPVSERQLAETDEHATADIRLLGIVSENQQFHALIQLGDNDVSAYTENMEIGDYRIQSIDKTRVIIIYKDQNETFTLFEQ